MYSYIIDKYYNGYTIRKYLEEFKLSTSKINRIINENKYLVNGEKKNLLHTGDLLEIEDIFNETEVEIVDLPIDIVFEDDYILVVNKPNNLIIYGDIDDTLDKRVANYLKKIAIKPIPRHIYRLDKDTIGLMIYAKDPLTLSRLSNDVENKILKKEYLAICHGITNKKGTLEFPIGKDRHNNNKMVVYKNGKEAITNYERIACNDQFSLLKINLLTGRTHQIRLHFSHINHPILGDKIYGCDNFSELKLQAYLINFVEPVTKKDLTITVKSKLHL